MKRILCLFFRNVAHGLSLSTTDHNSHHNISLQGNCHEYYEEGKKNIYRLKKEHEIDKRGLIATFFLTLWLAHAKAVKIDLQKEIFCVNNFMFYERGKAEHITC